MFRLDFPKKDRFGQSNTGIFVLIYIKLAKYVAFLLEITFE